MKLEAQDLWPIVLDFIATFFGEEDLQHFKKYFKLKIDHESDPIVKAGGIQALLGCYLKHNKDVYKQFKKHLKSKAKQDSDEEEEEEQETKKSKKNGSSKLAGNKRTKKEEGSSDEESSDEEDKKKRAKKQNDKSKKKAKESSSEDDSDSSSEDEKTKKVVRRVNGVQTRKRSESNMSEYVPPIKDPKQEAAKLGIDFKFQRINETKYSQTLTQVTADNSFESKARFGLGGGDKFGEWSNSKLADKVGKGFTKEKNKMKNRNFHSQGNRIGFGVNSVKFS